MFVEEFLKIGIEPKGNEPQQKLRCPKCKSIGKENWKDTCLSINLVEGIYNCHKCGFYGTVKNTIKETIRMNKTYVEPTRKGMKKLSAKGKKFLNDRGITDEVIERNKIASSTDDKFIVFPYIKGGELVNYKKRGVDGKFFIQAKDAKPIIYNYDGVKGQKSIVICEGEFDSLSWEVAGVSFHTSVNMGAPNKGDKSIDKKLECLTTCYDVFD